MTRKKSRRAHQSPREEREEGGNVDVGEIYFEMDTPRQDGAGGRL